MFPFGSFVIQIIAKLLFDLLHLDIPLAGNVSLRSSLAQFYVALQFTDERGARQPTLVNEWEGDSTGDPPKHSCIGTPIQRRNKRSVRRCIIPLARYLIESLSVLELEQRAELIEKMFHSVESPTHSINDHKSTTTSKASFFRRIDFGTPLYGTRHVESSPNFHTCAPNIIEVLQTFNGSRYLDRATDVPLNQTEIPVLHITGLGGVSKSHDHQQAVPTPHPATTLRPLSVLPSGCFIKAFPIRVPTNDNNQQFPFLYSLDLHAWPSCIPVGVRVKLSLLPLIPSPSTVEEFQLASKPQLVLDSFGCSGMRVFWLPPSSNISIQNHPNELRAYRNSKTYKAKLFQLPSLVSDSASSTAAMSNTASSPIQSSGEVGGISRQPDNTHPDSTSIISILQLAVNALPDDKKEDEKEDAVEHDEEVFLGNSGIPLSEKLPMRSVVFEYEIEFTEESDDTTIYGKWVNADEMCDSGTSNGIDCIDLVLVDVCSLLLLLQVSGNHARWVLTLSLKSTSGRNMQRFHLRCLQRPRPNLNPLNQFFHVLIYHSTKTIPLEKL